MHPKYIVCLEDDKGHIVEHEVFFNKNKAQRSYKRASKPDKDGLHELIGENDSYTARLDVKAVIRSIGDNISTKKDRWRKSFLNLTNEEGGELAERFRVPIKIIKEISRMEKDIVEKRRYYMRQHDEQTLPIRLSPTPTICSVHPFS